MYVRSVKIEFEKKQLTDKLNALKNINQICLQFFFSFPVFVYVGDEYDSLLKNFQIQHIELPLPMHKDLDEHARFKRKFGLYAMDLAFLSEFQCTTMEQAIEKKVLILQMKRRLKQIEKEAAKTKHDLNSAKMYVRSFFPRTFFVKSEIFSSLYRSSFFLDF